MRHAEAAQLKLGLYELFWVSGGSSLAAVGSTHDGLRWFAPTNWTSADRASPQVASTKWRLVERAEPILTN